MVAATALRQLLLLDDQHMDHLYGNSSSSATCHPLGEPVKAGPTAVGIFLIVGTGLAGVPQLLMIWKKRSSSGLSVVTPLMVVAYGFLNLASTVTLRWRQILSCAHGAACLLHLLDAIQQAVSTVTIFSILLSTVTFKPNNGLKSRVATLALVFLLVGIGVFTVVLSAKEPCSKAALDFADIVSIVAGVIVTIAFAPQLLETCRSRGRGSLSIWYYLIQTVGCFLVVGSQAIGFHDKWQIWGPTGVSGCLQACILTSAIYFRVKDRRIRDVAAERAMVNGDSLSSALVQSSAPVG